MKVTDQIKSLLNVHLSPVKLEISDDGSLHKGHKSQKETGGGHYSVLAVSPVFRGKSLLERHQLIYAALKDLQSEIHALAIKAYSPEELEKK